MIYAISAEEAMKRRRVIRSPGSGTEHWGAEYFGTRWPSGIPTNEPQALVAELIPHENVPAHYHGVEQFQIFTEGNGKMGRNLLQPITIQYKDNHTAYGPVISGDQGLNFYAMRIRTGAEAKPRYAHEPDYREKMKPSKRRHLISAPVLVSTEVVMTHRKAPAFERVLDVEKFDDGLDAHVARLGADMEMDGPDPRRSGGYYLFVINGELVHQGASYGRWSMIAVTREEAAYRLKAGPRGAEALVLEFPIVDLVALGETPQTELATA